MQDGDTIAIGGTISDTVSDQVTGIPLLDRIPYVGGLLFGSKTYTHSRSELIMFLTPHVIYDESGLIEASDEVKSRLKKMQKDQVLSPVILFKPAGAAADSSAFGLTWSILHSHLP